MKKQIAVLLSISLIVIALPIGVLLYLIKSDETMNDKKLSRVLFGIDLDHYTIIQKGNSLSKDERDGCYWLIIQMKKSQLSDFFRDIKESEYMLISEETLSYRYEEYKEKCELIAANTVGFGKDEIEQIYYYQGGSKRDWIKSKVTRWGFSTGYVFIVNLENEDYRVGLCYLD